MKELNGLELAGFIKERQAKQVRGLRQANGVIPKLAIVRTSNNRVIDTYIRLKKSYGDDILVEVDEFRGNEDEMLEEIAKLNANPKIYGIIVQLPLDKITRTDELVNAVAPEKDVDALGEKTSLDPATPTAINWLLTAYGVEMKDRKIVIVGNGRLVGRPLARMWRNSGYDVTVVNNHVDNLEHVLKNAEIVVTATGKAGLITSAMLKPGTVVVDAGTASEDGKIVGDVASEVRARDDLIITPEKGGVGPLTVCALFDNVIRAARAKATSN